MNLLKISLPVTDPVLVFSIILGVILIAPILFTRLKLPGIIGIIVAGVLLGPGVLGLINTEGSVTLLGQVGLLYIMFLAGLEINLNEFFKHKHRSLVFGIITFTIPQVLGTLVFRALGFDLLASLLIASMFASHTLVAYPIITRLGISRNNAVLTTVGGTILTDTAALLLLAVIARAHQGELSTSFWIEMTVMIALYSAVVILLLPRLSRWFFQHFQDQVLEFLYVLFVAFGFSYLARAAGIEPIVGAFFTGLVLNRMIPDTGPLMNRIQFVGNSIFIPIFLLYIGMLVDIKVLFSSWKAWGVMGTMMALNIGTKLIASKLTQRIFNYSRAEGWIIFGLSTTEAAATLAATLVGLRLGIIGDEILNGVILLILVTCILGPTVVQKYGREVAVAEEDKPYDPEEAPQRILVPLANPETSSGLMELALMMKDKSGEPVFPLTVAKQDSLVDSRIAAGEKMLQKAVEYAIAADVKVTPLTRVDVNIANGIARAIHETRISDVIIGWNGQLSAQQRIFGSILDQLLDNSSTELFVCNLQQPPGTNTRIILAVPPFFEHEKGFQEMLTTIKLIASKMGANILLISENRNIESVSKYLKKIKPESPVSKLGLEKWSSLIDILNSILESSDMILLISTRKGSVSWQRKLEVLPRKLSAKYPGNSLIVGFPATYPPSDDGTGSNSINASFALPIE
jgi:Kef-type K+ transport system membrane component KefB/nucleotide-binding universal stress UspA family protein